MTYHVNNPGLSYIEINVTLLHYYSGPSIKLFPSSTIIEIGNSSSVNVRGRELEHYFLRDTVCHQKMPSESEGIVS